MVGFFVCVVCLLEVVVFVVMVDEWFGYVVFFQGVFYGEGKVVLKCFCLVGFCWLWIFLVDFCDIVFIVIVW